MIYLKNIVKTSFILWLKRIIAIVIIAEFVLLALKVNEFLTLLDRFLKTQLNFSIYYWVGVFAVNYWFFYFIFKFIAKILDIYDDWR